MKPVFCGSLISGLSFNMSFDWIDYIKLSESLRCAAMCNQYESCCNDILLKIHNNQEASFRTIINRNYYASFKKIQDYCNRKHKPNIPKRDPYGKDYGSHDRIIKFIENYNAPLSSHLSILKQSRKNADYDSSAKINFKDVAFSFQQMNLIFQEFDKMLRKRII